MAPLPVAAPRFQSWLPVRAMICIYISSADPLLPLCRFKSRRLQFQLQFDASGAVRHFQSQFAASNYSSQILAAVRTSVSSTGDSDSSTVRASAVNSIEEVLSDPQKRAVYDQYGEEGLKGMPPPGSSGGDANGSGDFFFNPRNAEDIFAEFFGSSQFEFGSMNRAKSTRFQSDGSGGFFGRFAGPENVFRSYSEGVGVSGGGQFKKAPAVESKLACSLEELYTGSTRKMKISRNVIKENGQTVPESEILTIDVKPGWKKGTKITFPQKGNEQVNQLPADLVFIIDEKSHEVYKRDGNDLSVHQKVSLAEALTGTTVKLASLDGRDLTIPVTEIISPDYEIVIAKEGMPIAKEPGRKGNLRIKFEVKFPTRLTADQQSALKRILGG